VCDAYEGIVEKKSMFVAHIVEQVLCISIRQRRFLQPCIKEIGQNIKFFVLQQASSSERKI